MTDPTDQTGPVSRRRTFGPALLLGLAGGALAAVAGTKPWVVDGAASHGGDPIPGMEIADPVAAAGEMPAALALALVALATWGVVLVTRGTLRRAVAGLGLLASLGLTVSVVVGLFTLESRVGGAIVERGLTSDVVQSEFSPWFFAAGAGALMLLAATSMAVAWCPQWPEMGSRYDAPGADREAPPAEEQTNLDLWKSMDEGHDPTA